MVGNILSCTISESQEAFDGPARGRWYPEPQGPCQHKSCSPPPPTILCFWEEEGVEVDEWVDERLNRPEEGHTGAMAIPKTTYLVSHNDSACQNNCQDTQPGRNWSTHRPSNHEGLLAGVPTLEGSLGLQANVISVSLLTNNSDRLGLTWQKLYCGNGRKQSN